MKFNNAVRSIKMIATIFIAASTLPPIVSASQPSCDQIQHTCGEAGFTRDLPEGRDLMSKCFQPIMQGQKVAGVNIDPDLIKKCRDEQQKKPKSGQGKRRKHGG